MEELSEGLEWLCIVWKAESGCWVKKIHWGHVVFQWRLEKQRAWDARVIKREKDNSLDQDGGMRQS